MSLHVVPVRIYATILTALVILTLVTVWVAYFDFGPMNNVVALSIAVFKASLVVMFFMHVKYGTKMVKLVVGSSVVWLMILFAFVLQDYLTRGLFGVLGK